MPSANGKSGSMSVSLKNYKGLIKELKAINKDSETVIKRTVSDLWIRNRDLRFTFAQKFSIERFKSGE
jgi:hypothetical protein